MIFAIGFALILAVVASAANTIDVAVGADDQLVFSPLSVKAQAGDVIRFEFFTTNLSVTQSTFNDPCIPAPGGVDSGLLVPLDSNTHSTWSFTILNDTAPLWFFCSQISPEHHCVEGMVFAINDNEEQPFGSFQDAAKKTSIDSLGTQDAAPIPGATEAKSPGGPGSPVSVGPISAVAIAQPTATRQGSPDKSPNNAIGSRGLNVAGAISVVSLVMAVNKFIF